MIFSTESYVMMHEKDSFEELIKERKSLQREIAHLEKIVFDEKRESEEWMYKPSPDVEYQVNLDYLSALCKFISEKYNKEIVWGEEA